MPTQIQIYNLAVMQIGQEHILNPDEVSKTMAKIKDGWELLVDELLGEHDWTFARKRQSLPQLAAPPPFGFARAFQLPSDYLRLPENQADENAWSERPWRKEGLTILTDEEAVELLYIARVGPELFSSSFTVALSYRVAAAIAFVLTNKASIVKQMWDLYTLKIIDAQVADAAQTGKMRRVSRWQASRR